MEINRKLGLSVIFLTSLSSGYSSASVSQEPLINITSESFSASANEEQILARLNLTPKQQTQLEELRLQNCPKIQQLQVLVKQLNDKISQLQQNEQTPEVQVDLLGFYQTKHKILNVESHLYSDYEQKFLAILSPLQRITYYQSLVENKK